MNISNYIGVRACCVLVVAGMRSAMRRKELPSEGMNLPRNGNNYPDTLWLQGCLAPRKNGFISKGNVR